MSGLQNPIVISNALGERQTFFRAFEQKKRLTFYELMLIVGLPKR
jgi:hypothetical protein